MSRTQPRALLLDTCAVIRLASGESLPTHVVEAVVCAGLSAGVFVSPISAWEVGVLSSPRGNRAALQFTPEIAIDASCLPGSLHTDLADRLLIATARRLAVSLVTRDSKIIAYAGQGLVDVLPC